MTHVISNFLKRNLFKTGAIDGKGDRPLLVECGRMGNVMFF
ncbi:MAG: hypothetical protein V4642_08115 [Bacteroidota bacterium]